MDAASRRALLDDLAKLNGRHADATGDPEARTRMARIVEQEAQIQDVITALDGADRWVFLDPSFILRDFRSNNVIIATLAS